MAMIKSKDELQTEFKEDYYFLSKESFVYNPNDDFITLYNPLRDFVSKFELTAPHRNVDVEFDFPFLIKGKVLFEIPEGYEAQIPNSETINYNQQLIYAQQTNIIKNIIACDYIFMLDNTIYTPKDYIDLRNAMQKIINQTNQQIILKKKH